jgi:cholesterol oxidase
VFPQPARLAVTAASSSGRTNRLGLRNRGAAGVEALTQHSGRSMQSLDSAMRLRATPKRRGRGVRLQTEQDAERPNPTFIPAAEQAARWFAERLGGVAQSGLTESVLNIPTTAHILGGAVIAATAEEGVADSANRVFGYENLLVTDARRCPPTRG